MSTVDIDKLRAEILVEFKQVHKLAPADYTENCTNVVMKLIEAHTQTLKAELLAKSITVEVPSVGLQPTAKIKVIPVTVVEEL